VSETLSARVEAHMNSLSDYDPSWGILIECAKALRTFEFAQTPAMSAQLFCDWLRGYFSGLAGKDDLTAREANIIRNTLNSLKAYSLSSTDRACK